jgi:lipid-binding SYLF domain-containing protein
MIRVASIALFVAVGLLACATPKGDTLSEQRRYVNDMRRQTLAELYRAQPDVRARLEAAPGYAVFSNVKVQIFTFGAGHGFGIAHDNRSKRDSYMRVAEVAAGIGAGVKDQRVVFVFHDAAAFRRFVDEGWEFGAEGEAAAVSGDRGAALGAKGSATAGAVAAGATGRGGAEAGGGTLVSEGVEVFQFTENGLALRANVTGTRYWKDAALN